MIEEPELVVVKKPNCFYHDTGMSEKCDLISCIVQLNTHAEFERILAAIYNFNIYFFCPVMLQQYVL